MGLIICEIHGESGIIQMSELLHRYYINNKKIEVIKVIYEVEGLDNFVHYFSIVDDLSEGTQINNINEFDDYFSKISGDPGACVDCFNLYLNNKKIEIKEKRVLVSN
jgi:hypothetical protein